MAIDGAILVGAQVIGTPVGQELTVTLGVYGSKTHVFGSDTSVFYSGSSVNSELLINTNTQQFVNEGSYYAFRYRLQW